MRQLATAVALALCLIGCGAFAVAGTIPVRTTDTEAVAGTCYLAGTAAELILDPRAGLAWKFGPDDLRPVIWPRGYSARQVGSEIQVLNRDAVVIARSGSRAEFGVIKFDAGFVYGC